MSKQQPQVDLSDNESNKHACCQALSDGEWGELEVLPKAA